MGLGASIALFVGVPVAVIVGLGFVLNQFREPILRSAGAVGGVLAGVFTRPFTSFIDVVSTAFSDLPDIQIRIPGFNISQGLVTFDVDPIPGNIIPGTDQLLPGVTPGGITIPEGCTVRPDGTISCPTPPSTNLFPEAGATGFTLAGEPGSSILVTDPFTGERERVTRTEIVERFPDVVGIFDLLSTRETEFLPLSAFLVEQLGGAEQLRLSGQIFQEIPSVQSVVGGA